VTQPRYSPDGVLHFVSDRTGWWNLYRADGSPSGQPLAPAEAEFAGPDWVFGISTYALLADGTVVAAWSSAGRDHLGMLVPGDAGFEELPTPYTAFRAVRATSTGVVVLAASTELPPAVATIAVPSATHQLVRASRPVSVDRAYLSVPEPIEFPTGGGLTAHALVYPPTNPGFAAPDGERPPLIVAVHGGPTSSAAAILNYELQFWTSRGFAVADVDYGGSSGYGRAYRHRLQGRWGEVDVADCEAAATALAEAGRVDRGRMVIHGGSAGGYTVLAAVTNGAVFAAGASYYGVADIAALARDTHKFEARYLDGLVGPWPATQPLYEERSPIFHVDRLATPLIIFQGLEDKVVPPNQAEMMVDALRGRGVPVAYLAYPGEQHGFRQAANIMRTTEAELSFYGQVLGFVPAGPIEPVHIDNADAIAAGR
jgi:dipeptidyl aminopeptidase/acylaminoacyl peptidase